MLKAKCLLDRDYINEIRQEEDAKEKRGRGEGSAGEKGQPEKRGCRSKGAAGAKGLKAKCFLDCDCSNEICQEEDAKEKRHTERRGGRREEQPREKRHPEERPCESRGA